MKVEIRLCMGSSCYTRGNHRLLAVIKAYIEKNRLAAKVDFRGHLCQCNCNNGPNLSIAGQKFHEVSESSVERILNDTLSGIYTE